MNDTSRPSESGPLGSSMTQPPPTLQISSDPQVTTKPTMYG